jgi:hypothetical protein
MEKLKEEAKELYFRDVFIPSSREKFIEDLEKYPLEDLRSKGWTCTSCVKHAENPCHTPEKDKVVYLWNGPAIWKIIICHQHYDGCKGWN